jgi:3-oxosteroid 1-dehydrogenase
VIGEGGTPITGLYATGNASASVMGLDYAGAGATIGPAIVFGWIAARHACSDLDAVVTRRHPSAGNPLPAP